VSDFEFHEPGPDDESHKDYVYHATNTEGAHGVADDGHLHVHRPWHGTDQEAWPDGSTKKRAYFSRNAGGVHSFAPEEGPHAVVRVRRDAHPFEQERYTRDVYTTMKIPAKHVEVRHKEGAWHPISALARKEESEDWDPQQIFSAGGSSYHIGRLAAHARERLKPVNIPVKDLKHNLVGADKLDADEPLWSRSFRKRSKKAHIKHPIMLQRDDAGKHRVMDGVHRLGKAIMKGHENIRAYVFPHDQMPDSARAEESLLVRSPLLLERSASTYSSRKERSFKGGKLNLHTPREGHWLPKQVEPEHHEGIYRRGAKGPRKKRKGSYLRDEPMRHRAEPIRRSIGSSFELDRTKLLLDHDKPT